MYVIIDNYDSFTYNLHQYLSTLTDEPIKVFRNDKVDVKTVVGMQPTGVIISPGPGRPEDAGVSVELIRQLAGRIPVLGVCLGHQALGQAFGAQIIQARQIVHGKTDAVNHDGRGVFRGIPQGSEFTRYHSLVIDPATVPGEFEISARSSDGEVMGIRHKHHVLEGVQFHPESIASEQGKRLLGNFLSYRREPFDGPATLTKLIAGRDLTMQESALVMDEVTDGNMSPTQLAAVLTALSCKGYVAAEIAGFASVLKRKKRAITSSQPLLDTCGTGGDGTHTFNISSLAALTAAAAGAVVAKHGNRSVSSRSGSAEFFAALGYPIDLPPEVTQQLLAQSGFAFLYAPIYHGSMRHAAPVRQELGVKTVMNLVGPLANPADAQFQLIGVFSRDLCQPVAEAAQLLGVKRALVVHGADGLDELSVTGANTVVELEQDGSSREYQLHPRDVGVGTHTIDLLVGGDPEANAELARQMLAGNGRPALVDAVILNAGAALYVYGAASDLQAGVVKARQALSSGAVAKKLVEVCDAAQRLGAAAT